MSWFNYGRKKKQSALCDITSKGNATRISKMKAFMLQKPMLDPQLPVINLSSCPHDSQNLAEPATFNSSLVTAHTLVVHYYTFNMHRRNQSMLSLFFFFCTGIHDGQSLASVGVTLCIIATASLHDNLWLSHDCQVASCWKKPVGVAWALNWNYYLKEFGEHNGLEPWKHVCCQTA